jgi:hypothetical protein
VTQQPQQVLGVAQLGLSEPELRWLRAVVAAATASGQLAAGWQIGELATARVLIVATAALEELAPATAREGAGQPLVAVLAGDLDEVPAQYARLQRPVRLVELIALLRAAEKTASELTTPSVPEPQPGSAPVTGQGAVSGQSLVRLAALIRTSDAPNPSTWRVSGLSAAPLYVAPAQRLFYLGESLAALRRIDPDVRLEFARTSPDEAQFASEAPKPLLMLQWLVGTHTGTLGLLPWLPPEGTFRLRRFPEFQILHHRPEHRRLAAALVRPRPGLRAIAELTELDAAAVSGFLNAADLCGYLQSDARPVADADSAPPPALVARPRRLLAQALRRAMGITLANA